MIDCDDLIVRIVHVHRAGRSAGGFPKLPPPISPEW